ncbi:YtxH domain-containing protein [Paenibacillus urinalis]|uniref:YtxH domain-containing protein n=1 Tax=Paenibacillus urinalis TaxID=521520 RepID=A0AAX3N386_9BACL|nr:MULTISPECIES: YtxH domain-containing protein [Paenibacillus]WDH84310.1 YtxH domain-containing protein [Paenibacillus urinalis]WDH95779.1 YtxH domain-containing protein [Paenibacillus urinalis]WDI03993.1 YtxH domain-containing protein [Paenibacillus urinalis]GAK38699.1 hypothetical protein TCA2_0425 [Paenibacillus sp. TCA20]
MKDTNKSLLWGTLIGTVAGSITALLFAPKSGAELREDIAENAKLVTEKGQNLAEKVSEQSVRIASKVKESTEGFLQDIRGISSGNEVAKVSGISEPAKTEQTAEEAAEDDTL